MGAKIIEYVGAPSNHNRVPQPVSLVRLGLSLSGSSVILADGKDYVYFDSEGFFVTSEVKKKVSVRFLRSQTVALLVNLDAASPNANTVSLFRDGKRVSEPQPLPEHL